MNKNLMILKTNLQKELNSYAINRLNLLTETENTIADDMYSANYKNQKREETKKKIEEIKEVSIRNMENYYKNFEIELKKFNILKDISPETFENKITNILNLLKINENTITLANLNFLVESKAYDILRSLKEAFPMNKAVLEAFILVDPSATIRQGELILTNAKRYAEREYLDVVSIDKLGKAILEMFNEEEEVQW